MFKGFFQNVLTLPNWPKSLRQSTDNPLQPDRLEDTSHVELQYPTRRFTPAEDRRHTWRLLSYGALAGLTLSLAEIFLFKFGWNEIYLSTYSAIAVWVFAVTALQRRKTRWRWFVYCFLCPAITVTLFCTPEPYFKLALAMLAAMYVADRFATHYFFLKTAVPMPRDRANRLRALWGNRFRIFGAPAQGVEFYKFSFITIPLVYLFLFYFSRKEPTGDFLENVPLFFSSLLLLLFFPLVFEALAAFLFNRPYVSPRMMFRAFRRAVVEWFTYNRHGSVAPATFQSPSGDYYHRRRMGLAVIVLFAAWVAPYFSRNRDEVFLEFRAARINAKLHALPSHGPQPSNRTPSTQGVHYAPLRLNSTSSLITPAVLRRTTSASPAPFTLAQYTQAPLYRPSSPELGEKPEPKPEPIKLEPYQKAMLERMPAEERAKYLANLRSKQEAQKKAEEQLQREKSLAEEGNPRDRLALYALLSVLVRLLYVVYPTITTVLPPLFFLACCFTTAARVVGFYGQQLGTNDPEKLLSTQTWDDLVSRIQASGDEIEKHSLLLGVNAIDGSPVIVPREVFQEHAHLLGDSGSGKTSLGMASLITQLIRFTDSTVVILDLKGDDLALFEGARIEAERAGLRFRWFTNEIGRSSYVFNPFTQRHFSTLSLYQRTDVLTTAMGLQYGAGYGRSYYSDANSDLLYQIISKSPAVSSFDQLAMLFKCLADTPYSNRRLLQDASHIITSTNRLADCEPLNASRTSVIPPRPGATPCSPGALENAIDFGDAFQTPQVLYFYLPSSIGSTSSADIARLTLYSLLSASKAAGSNRCQVYLFIDEFQRIIAQNLELILQTARSMNIGAILANQTLSDLKTAGIDLISTVRANTRFKQIFAASDLLEQQGIMQTSGETLVYSRTWSEYLGGFLGVSAGGGSATSTETITPRLRPNDILLASDHPFQSIVYVARGKGYAQYGGMPFVMTSAYHITYDEYALRRKAPWPDRPNETITLKLRLPGPQAVPPSPSQPVPLPVSETPDPVIGTPGARIEIPPAAGARPAAPDKEKASSPLFQALDQHWKDQQAPKSTSQEGSNE